MISNPILHDIIKSELTHNTPAVFNICKNIPCLKNSNLFKKDYWVFRQARQEEINIRYRKADVVWYFEGKKNDNYYIVHEVKTGWYDVLDIYNKYHTGMSGQIWIWGWNNVNNTKILGEFYQRKIKIIDIENLKPLLTSELNTIYTGLME